MLAAAAAERTLVVCLRALAEVLAARVREREPQGWPGRHALAAHARRLAERIPALAGVDVVLETAAREAEGVAAEVLDVTSSREIA